jgi:hypothetical protein
VLAVVLQRGLVGAHTQRRPRASAYGTAFWWSVAITVLAIIPCVILTRAESNARKKSALDESAAMALAEPEAALVEALA